MKKIVATTSCPVGIAHTYMAAENLEKAGKELGVEVKVETHGSIGVENELAASDINEAAGVIIAADTKVDKSRFWRQTTNQCRRSRWYPSCEYIG